MQIIGQQYPKRWFWHGILTAKYNYLPEHGKSDELIVVGLHALMATSDKTGTLRLAATNRQILSLALPISFALLVPQFNYLVNSLFLSRLGTGYLGAAGITGVYYLIFAAIGYGLNNGLQALISRRAGQDRLEDIGSLSVQSMYLSFFIAAFGIIVTYAFAPVILRNSVDPALYKQSLSFLQIRIWGLPFLYLYQMRNGLLVGTNQSRLLIWGTLAETIANVVLDYCLIFGQWGFPAMGFNGAAYASIAAETIGMLAVFFIIKRKGLSDRFNLFSDMRLKWVEMKLLLTQSSPLIVQYAISIISWEFFFILVSHHGRVALDISQFMRIIIGFLGVFIWSFASTTNTMVSNFIGQDKRDLVMPLISKILRLSIAFSLMLSIPLQLFPESFLRLMQDDPAFITQGVPVIRVVSVAMLMMSFSTIWLSAVTGTGNTAVNLAIEAITITGYCLYVWLVLAKFNLSITWGWMSEWLYWLSMFSMSFLYMRSGRWRRKEI
jgi:MATE family multidrug resistance protein